MAIDDDLTVLIERMRSLAADCEFGHPLDLSGPAIAVVLREAADAIERLDAELDVAANEPRE